MVPSMNRKTAATTLTLGVAAWLLVACGTDGAPPVTSAAGSLSRSQAAFAEMSAASRDVVSHARVPFLLLPRPWSSVAIATSGPRWSALSARDAAITISLHGTDATHHTLDPHETRRATARPQQGAAPRPTVRGVPALVTENEGIRSVAWTEGGVYWALEVECVNHERDTRCTDDAFILDVATRLEPAPTSRSAATAGAAAQPRGVR